MQDPPSRLAYHGDRSWRQARGAQGNHCALGLSDRADNGDDLIPDFPRLPPLADAALRFRLRAHKPSRPEAKSGNVPGSGTAVTTGVPPGTTEIRVSGPVPKENVAAVIVVLAVTPERACPSSEILRQEAS